MVSSNNVPAVPVALRASHRSEGTLQRILSIGGKVAYAMQIWTPSTLNVRLVPNMVNVVTVPSRPAPPRLQPSQWTSVDKLVPPLGRLQLRGQPEGECRRFIFVRPTRRSELVRGSRLQTGRNISGA